jgi:hypothetical protein
MNLKDILGFILTASLLLPIFIILAYRLYRFVPFIALGICFTLAFFDVVMMLQYIQTGSHFRRIFGITNNLLEVPLLLIFFSWFSPSSRLTRHMRYVILVFIAFEIIITASYGYNVKALTIILAPGLTIILFFCAWFFIRQIKIAIIQGKAIGKAIIISSLLFAFGCYTLIYVMHYIAKTPHTTDVYIMYLIASAISVTGVSAGILMEKKRIRKLEELQLTRRELSKVYGNS